MVVENSTLHFLPRSLQLNMKMKMNSSKMPSKSSKEEEPIPSHTEESHFKDHKKKRKRRDTHAAIEDDHKKKRKRRDTHAAIEEDSTSIKHAKTEENTKKKKKNEVAIVLQEPNGYSIGSFELEDIIAGFLNSRGLQNTLSAFLSETQHEYTKRGHTVQLEDIYHHYLNRIDKSPKEWKAEEVKFEETNFGKKLGTEFNEEDTKKEKNKARFRENDDAKVVDPIISSSCSDEGAIEKYLCRSDKNKEFATEAMDNFSERAQNRRPEKAEKNSEMVTDTRKGKAKLSKAINDSEQLLEFDEPVFDSQKHKGEKKKVASEERTLTDNEEQISRKKSKKVKVTPKKILQSTECDTLHGKTAKENIAQLTNDSDSLVDITVSKKNKKIKLHDMSRGDDEELTFGKKSKKEKMRAGNSQSTESHATNKESKEERLEDLSRDARKSSDFQVKEEKKTKEKNSAEMTLKEHSNISIYKKSKKEKKDFEKLQTACPNAVNGAKEIRDYVFEDNDSRPNIGQAHMTIEANKSITSGSVVSRNDSKDPIYKNRGAPGEQGGGKNTKANVSPNSKDNQKKSNTPKTAKSFQRVKMKEVKFSDPRLQDNSYWGKDGAENGYGAQAQEVLGKVKGKDFRHQKTRKKRGSYTGGMIDLQSHSIKFSYSDGD